MLWFRDVCIKKQDQQRLRGRHGTYTGSSRTSRRWTHEQSEGDTRPLEWENPRAPRSTPRIIIWFGPKWQGMGHTKLDGQEATLFKSNEDPQTFEHWSDLRNKPPTMIQWLLSQLHASRHGDILEWDQPFHNRTARKTRSASVLTTVWGIYPRKPCLAS